jgi:hypothetical protein
VLELGNDVALTTCSSFDLTLIGLNDAINCIAKEKGATPVDGYTLFQSNCTNSDCFADSLHPNDKGYGLIFDAFRDTPGSPVPATPPPDGSWPIAMGAPSNTSPPTVMGIPAPGAALSCSVGSWSGSPPFTYTIQWRRDNTAIAGQTGPVYHVARSDVGHAISCQVTASNAFGSAARTSGSVTVAGFPRRARIWNIAETNKAFAPSSRRHKHGTTFSFRLDRPAEVTIVIERQAPGRRAGPSCRPPDPRLRHKPRCVRTILITTTLVQGHAGLNKIAFSGRVHGRPLKPGRYAAVVAVVNLAGTSTGHLLQFTIHPR